MSVKTPLGSWVTMTVTLTLCVVVVGMVSAMLIGLFDNDDTFDKIEL